MQYVCITSDLTHRQPLGRVREHVWALHGFNLYGHWRMFLGVAQFYGSCIGHSTIEVT